MKDGAQALMTAMAHVGAARKHCLQVRGTIRDRSDQYAENVEKLSKRLDVPEGDALAPEYDYRSKQESTRHKGILNRIRNS